jgi:hypothetical protein
MKDWQNGPCLIEIRGFTIHGSYLLGWPRLRDPRRLYISRDNIYLILRKFKCLFRFRKPAHYRISNSNAGWAGYIKHGEAQMPLHGEKEFPHQP